MNKMKCVFYHDNELGYVLKDLKKEIVLMDIPISESHDLTNKARIDVNNYIRENNLTLTVEDSIDESKIEFENGLVVDGYSRYEGNHRESLKLWGFSLVRVLEAKYRSSKGFMGVNFDGVKSEDDLLENIEDEIFSITELIEQSDIQEEFGMTEREAKGYVQGLKDFVSKYYSDH